MSEFLNLFSHKQPVLGVIHLKPLPGAPRYEGNMGAVYEHALQEAELYRRAGVDGIIVENFQDAPFFPDTIPIETVAAMAPLTREVVKISGLPVGVNALRNDAPAAMAIAAAAQAHFIRVNVHLGAVVADQGIIQGNAHLSLRLRAQLKAPVLILADVGVKHAAPLVQRGLQAEAKELAERGKVDGLIVSGQFTGDATRPEDLEQVTSVTNLPVLIGSGTTPANLPHLKPLAGGFIVGSWFKQDGKVENALDEQRIRDFMALARA